MYAKLSIKECGSIAGALSSACWTQVYAKLSNIPKARQWYRTALLTDGLCYPAFQVSCCAANISTCSPGVQRFAAVSSSSSTWACQGRYEFA